MGSIGGPAAFAAAAPAPLFTPKRPETHAERQERLLDRAAAVGNVPAHAIMAGPPDESVHTSGGFLPKGPTGWTGEEDG